MTKFDVLVCHLCNIAGTESCDEGYGSCFCKPWYEGEYCQNCRFSRDYVLAPNGSCIPCNCGLRSIYECFQSNLCMKYAGDSVREAVAVSALFLSAIATITCLSVCIVWRIITRSKRLRPSSSECFEEQNVEIGNSGRASRVDLTSGFSANGFSDDEESTSDRRLLLTPISVDFDSTSAFATQSPRAHSFSSINADQYNAFVKKGSYRPENKNEIALNKNDTTTAGPSGLERCTEYHFLNVPCDSANDEDCREGKVV